MAQRRLNSLSDDNEKSQLVIFTSPGSMYAYIKTSVCGWCPGIKKVVDKLWFFSAVSEEILTERGHQRATGAAGFCEKVCLASEAGN